MATWKQVSFSDHTHSYAPTASPTFTGTATFTGNVTVDVAGNAELKIDGGDANYSTLWLGQDGAKRWEIQNHPTADELQFHSNTTSDILKLSQAGVATFAGKVDLTNATSWEPQLRIFSTHTGAAPGQLQFWKLPSDDSSADGDYLGQIGWAGKNSNDDDTWYSTMYAKSLDITHTEEDFGFYIDGLVAGVDDTNVFKIEYGNATFGGMVGAGIAPSYPVHAYASSGSTAVRAQIGSAYIDLYPHGSWNHIIGSSAKFYFNKEIQVDSGLIGSYNEDLQLRTQGTTRLTLSNSTGNATFGGKVQLTGDDP